MMMSLSLKIKSYTKTYIQKITLKNIQTGFVFVSLKIKYFIFLIEINTTN